MTMPTPILEPDPDSKQWNDFTEALFSALGKRAPDSCRGDHRHTRRLLDERGYHVEATIAIYRERGGFCDCKILFNVDRPTREDDGEE
jgi:hypothetical protein